MKIVLTVLSLAALASLAFGATGLTEVVCMPSAVAQAWS